MGVGGGGAPHYKGADCGSFVQLLSSRFKLFFFSCVQLNGFIYYLVLAKLTFAKRHMAQQVPQRQQLADNTNHESTREL